MASVSVVGDAELAVKRRDRVRLSPQALRLLRVVGEHLGAIQAVGVARDHRGGEVGRRSARALEDRVGDLLTVDRARQRGAAQLALLAGEVLKLLRNGEGLEHSSRLVHSTLTELVLEGGEGGVRNGVEHIQVAGEQVGVGRVLLSVKHKVHTVVLRGAITGVLLVRDDRGVLVVVPLGQLVGAVGDRVFTVGVDVVVRARVHRVVGGVAQSGDEVGFRLVQLDGERLVVDDLEALHLGLALFVAQDWLEEVSAQKGVLDGVVPRLNKIFGGDRGAVGPLDVVLERYAVGLVPLKIDGFSELVMRVAFPVVIHEAGEDVFHDAAAAGLVGVARNQRVLWLAAVSEDVVVTAATLSVV